MLGLKFRISLVFFIVVCNSFLFSQCFEKNTVFKSGEIITYDIFYNWGFVWLDSGEAYFAVKSTTHKNKPAYLFISNGKSKENYDWFFKVRDKYQTIMDSASLRPVIFTRNTMEGSYSVNNQYIFKGDLVFSTIENSDTIKYKDTLKINNCTYDLLSSLYFVRNIDFQNFSIKDSVNVETIVDNKVYNITVKYLGKEIIENKKNDKFNCIKLSASLIKGTIFKDGQTMTVWISDDNNKIPIKVEAEILIGSVIAFISQTKGLKYNLTSKIN